MVLGGRCTPPHPLPPKSACGRPGPSAFIYGEPACRCGWAREQGLYALGFPAPPSTRAAPGGLLSSCKGAGATSVTPGPPNSLSLSSLSTLFGLEQERGAGVTWETVGRRVSLQVWVVPRSGPQTPGGGPGMVLAPRPALSPLCQVRLPGQRRATLSIPVALPPGGLMGPSDGGATCGRVKTRPPGPSGP